jgi:transposase
VNFLWANGPKAKDIQKKMFPLYGGECLSYKAVDNWVKKFSEGHSKVADDSQPGHPVQIVIEVTVQRVEEFIQADRRIMTDSVVTALGCSHGLAYSTMHDRLKFQKVHTVGAHRTKGSRKKLTEWVCPCNISYSIQMKENICLTGLLLG